DSDETRAADYQRWVHHYNHHRPHTGIDGQTPSDRVHNLTRNYS
ncbi:integrase core domain-containing protein, partial [Gryllotalpicola koreensis]